MGGDPLAVLIVARANRPCQHVDDVDGFHRRAVAAGADVLKAPRDEPWGMRELGLRSPDGHRFMLGQPVESA